MSKLLNFFKIRKAEVKTEPVYEEEIEDSEVLEEDIFFGYKGNNSSDLPPDDNMEYELVEREILPAKIICPDCGGITLEGLDFCDKCGGEL